MLVLVLSLLPAPLMEPALAQGRDGRSLPPPPAEAVQLLEQLRNQGQERVAGQRRQGPRGARPRPGRARNITRQGCEFREQGQTWILLHNCRPRGTIVIPKGFTLNGRNHALIVTGNFDRFAGAVLASGFGSANVRNLRIEGKGRLTGDCLGTDVGIFFFYSAGTIANVTIRNLDPGPSGCLISAGIYAFGERRVNILNSTLQSAGAVGLILNGTVAGTVAGNDFRIATRLPTFDAIGIAMNGTSGIAIRDNDFRRAGDDEAAGIVGSEPQNLAIVGNRFQGVTFGIDLFNGLPSTAVAIHNNHLTGVTGEGISVMGGVVNVVGNSVAGVTPALGASGLTFGFDAAGVANNNGIANFDCGITLNASLVTLGAGAEANPFANNTQDVCP